VAEDVAAQVYDRTLAFVRSQPSGKARRQCVREAAERLGVSSQTVYRQLKKRGWTTGRQTRRDAGQSTVSDADLGTIASIVARGRNKRGQVNVPVVEAVNIARDAGLIGAGAKYSNVCRRLRGSGLDRRRMCAQAPGIFRVSNFPNAVWFFDISVAIQWYFRDENGRKLELYGDAGSRFYEGKVENFKKLRRVIRRYAITDHRSGAYFVRYYYGSGETGADVVDFLWHAMSESPLTRSVAPFGGVPHRMVLDQGSANKSALVTNLLQGLGVEAEFHAVGNAKASGSVESRHNHWQRRFEGRLSQNPAPDLQTLNEWALKFGAKENAERPHSRHGMPPNEMWLTITPDQLIECPDRDTFFQLAASHPREGVLTNRLVLRADGRKWFITGEHVYPRQRVKYRLSPFVEAGIRVWDAEGRELSADELQFDEAGFPVAGPRHVWGDDEAEGFSHKQTAARRVVQRIDDDEDDLKVASVFDGLDSALERHRYLTPTGQTWSPATEAAEAVAAEPRLSSTEAREHVARELGRAIGSDGAWWRDRIGDGVTESQLDELLAEFRARESGIHHHHHHHHTG